MPRPSAPDASPLFPRYEVPLTGRARFAADAAWSDCLAGAARRAIADPARTLDTAHLTEFGIDAPRHYQIYRRELWLEIQGENRDALASAANAGAADLGLPTPPSVTLKRSTDAPSPTGKPPTTR